MRPLARIYPLGFLAIAGCNLPASDPAQLSFSAGQPSMMAAAGALTAAGEDLLGPQPVLAGVGAIAGVGGAGGLSGTPYQQTRAQEVSASLTQRHVLRSLASGGELALVGAVSIGASSTAWHLPQGLGVLVDPLDIRVNSQSVAPELRLHWQRPLRLAAPAPARIEAYAGAGVLMARSQTSLRSALLAYDHASHTTQPYLVAGITLAGASQGPVQSGLGLRVTASRQAGVEAGLRFELRH